MTATLLPCPFCDELDAMRECLLADHIQAGGGGDADPT